MKKMTDLIKHPEFGAIRTVIRKGEPWFSKQDVLSALGLQTIGTAGSQYLDDDEKGVEKIHTPGGVQEMAVVNESRLYTLIVRSNKPEAKKFRKWVTSEVLPSIRRNGYYVHPEYFGKKEMKQLQQRLGQSLQRYLPEEEIRRVAKKFGVNRCRVIFVMNGVDTNNAIMQECQQRALQNKENEINAYHPDRLRSVTEKLNRSY